MYYQVQLKFLMMKAMQGLLPLDHVCGTAIERINSAAES